MGNLGKLNIVISAVNKSKAVFGQVTQSLNKVKNQVGSALKAFGMLTAGIGALGGALALIGKKSFDFLDVIGKIASRTGATTDLIQAFQLSAIQSGASIETANKALQKFAKMIGEGRKGLKTYTDIFDRYNVALLDAGGNERTFNEVLKDTMTGMMKSQNVFLRNADLALLFGRAGQELTSTIMMGGEALDDFIEKNKTLGLIIETEAIKNTEKFNDRLSRIGFAFRVLRDSITTAFLPVLDDFADKFEKTLAETNIRDFGKELTITFITSFSKILVATDVFINGVSNSFGSFANIIKGIQVQFLKLNAIGQELAFSLSFGLSGSLERAKELTDQANLLFQELAKPPETNTFLTESLRSLNDIRDTIINSVTPTVKEGTTEMMQSFTEMQLKLQEFARQAQAPLNAFQQSFKTTGAMIGDTIVSSMKKFEDTLVDGLMSGKFAFKDFANFVIKELLRIAIKKFIIDKITGGFSSFLGGLGKRERGGTVTANRPYLVGEAGAELFVPNKTGTIMPNNRLGGGMASGGMPVNITYNIQAFDSRDTLQAITENAPTISAIIESEFNKRGRRGFVT